MHDTGASIVQVARPRLEELYQQHVPHAEALARALTGDPHLAQDLAHEAFIRVAGRSAHLRHPDAFGAYLRQAVVNLSRSRFRRARLERGRLPMQEAAIGPDHSVEDRDQVLVALRQLPGRQRAAVVLRYFEDLSEAEVGRVLRCSPRAVNSLVSRAMVTLRAALEADR
jgi:RNA polymerase sigma-70 factor (sigma-E family)